MQALILPKFEKALFTQVLLINANYCDVKHSNQLFKSILFVFRISHPQRCVRVFYTAPVARRDLATYVNDRTPSGGGAITQILMSIGGLTSLVEFESQKGIYSALHIYSSKNPFVPLLLISTVWWFFATRAPRKAVRLFIAVPFCIQVCWVIVL